MDYIIKIVCCAPTFGLLAIALRRKFEKIHAVVTMVILSSQ
jgi:hypothetical protein